MIEYLEDHAVVDDYDHGLLRISVTIIVISNRNNTPIAQALTIYHDLLHSKKYLSDLEWWCPRTGELLNLLLFRIDKILSLYITLMHNAMVRCEIKHH